MGMEARQDCQSLLLLLLAPQLIRGFSMVHKEAGQQVGIICHPQQPVNSSNMCHAMIKVSLKPSIDIYCILLAGVGGQPIRSALPDRLLLRVLHFCLTDGSALRI